MSLKSEYLQDIKSNLEKIHIPQIENDSPKISIIIPTYNDEKFIAKCLFSVVKQTLENIEIIIINDGSTDDTQEVISIFASKDKRIKTIIQENSKQGHARNQGVELANGEYVGFVDADDWIDLDFFEKLYTSAKKYNADIALATNIRIGGNKKTKKRLNITKENFVTSIKDKLNISKQSKNPCPTNKIYKLSLLKENNITWPEGVYCEDKIYTLKALYYANGIVSVPNTYYYYFRNPSSTVNSKTAKHLQKIENDKNSANLEVLNFLKEKNIQEADNIFWATTKKIKLLGITLLKIKQSIKTKKYLLFGIIPITIRTGE